MAHELERSETSMSWPFSEPEDTEVITLGRIHGGESPLLLVTHDADDGEWQFLDGEHVFENDAVVARLGEMFQFDLSILEVADLPVGWYAWRAASGDPWQRESGEPPIVI